MTQSHRKIVGDQFYDLVISTDLKGISIATFDGDVAYLSEAPDEKLDPGGIGHNFMTLDMEQAAVLYRCLGELFNP